MGRNSGGVRGETSDGGGAFKGAIENIAPLVTMKDKALYRETKNAISRYHAVMGVRQREVKLADMDAMAVGVHVTRGGKSEAVYLNRYHYDKRKSDFVKDQKARYAEKWSTKTNKPSAHTVTHELAHATWNSHLKSPKHKAAEREIQALYDKWKSDNKRRGYGEYAKSNVNEFWAETVTKAVHGKADKYTHAVKNIAKKYKL